MHSLTERCSRYGLIRKFRVPGDLYLKIILESSIDALVELYIIKHLFSIVKDPSVNDQQSPTKSNFYALICGNLEFLGSNYPWMTVFKFKNLIYRYGFINLVNHYGREYSMNKGHPLRSLRI